MARRRLAILGALAAALAFAWGAMDSLRPFVTFEREVPVSTPGLGALESRFTVTLMKDDEVCVKPVVFTPEAEVVRLRILGTDGPPVSPLQITAKAPGYESTTVLRNYPAPGDQTPWARIEPAPRELEGEVCAKNLGERQVEIVGNSEGRSQTKSDVIVNGENQPGKELEVTLLEGDLQSLASRPGDLIDHARALSADYAPKWALWILLVLVALGIPAGVVAGYYKVLRD